MKADHSGTPSEQARHSAGWITPTQAKARAVANRCRDCRHYVAATRLHSGSVIGGKCMELNLATKPLATCAKWEAKP